MKKFLAVLLLVLMMATTCAASPNAELEAAELRLVCAICSMGAYSDKNSQLMTTIVTERGWQIETLSQKNNRANAKAYLVSKGNKRILTIAGTESWKDIEVDFRVGRVRLNGDESIDADKKITSDEIFLHRGFRDYTDLVLSEGLTERLKTFLEKNPNETLYITGHSLGGAVATIAAIRLIDSGVSPNRIKVITFGAPAVGSKALAAAYEDKIDLTRIVMKGDVIKKSLLKLGYVQFGKVLEYEPSPTSNQFEHKMTIYLDCVIRDYYAKGGNLRYAAQNKIATPVYAAPVHIVKDSFHPSDVDLILNLLDDDLTNHFANLTFAADRSIEIPPENVFDKDFEEYVAAAKSHGCKYVLIRVISAKKIRDALSGAKRVTVEELILDSEGLAVSMQTAGASTKSLTVFEAALASQQSLNEDLKKFFK